MIESMRNTVGNTSEKVGYVGGAASVVLWLSGIMPTETAVRWLMVSGGLVLGGLFLQKKAA